MAVPACFVVASLSLLAQSRATAATATAATANSAAPTNKHRRLGSKRRRLGSKRRRRSRRVNPFETAPRVLQTQPQLETPKPEAAPQLRPGQRVVDSVDIRGLRRVSPDMLKATMVTKPGDIYDEELLRRDFMALWNTNRFDDIRLETEAGATKAVSLSVRGRQSAA